MRGGGLSGDDDAVLVLGARISWHCDAAGLEGLCKQGAGVGCIGGGYSFSLVEEVEGAAKVLRNEVDLALLEGGLDDLARAEDADRRDRIAAVGQCLPVQLGEDLALDEVE